MQINPLLMGLPAEIGQFTSLTSLDISGNQLTRELVRMFNSPASNPQNAQLVFTTHDASLWGESLLRRDQVWFVQKRLFWRDRAFFSG